MNKISRGKQGSEDFVGDCCDFPVGTEWRSAAANDEGEGGVTLKPQRPKGDQVNFILTVSNFPLPEEINNDQSLTRYSSRFSITLGSADLIRIIVASSEHNFFKSKLKNNIFLLPLFSRPKL